MTAFLVGDTVRVELPRGYSKRGVLGISVLYTTSPESRFEGAIGTVSEINPQGLYSVHQYLVDFRGHDNGRLGIPWQAQWFREEWLELEERRALVGAAVGESARSESPTGTRVTAEDSASPVSADTSPGGTDQTPEQEEQERARLEQGTDKAPAYVDQRTELDIAGPARGGPGRYGEQDITAPGAPGGAAVTGSTGNEPTPQESGAAAATAQDVGEGEIVPEASDTEPTSGGAAFDTGRANLAGYSSGDRPPIKDKNRG